MIDAPPSQPLVLRVASPLAQDGWQDAASSAPQDIEERIVPSARGVDLVSQPAEQLGADPEAVGHHPPRDRFALLTGPV